MKNNGIQFKETKTKSGHVCFIRNHILSLKLYPNFRIKLQLLLLLRIMAPLVSLLYFALSAPILLTLGRCPANEINLSPLPSPLIAPIGTKPSFVSIGIGTQNYTCANTSTYTNVGALAELFDISCLYNTPLFDAMPDIAIAAWKATPASITAANLISSYQTFKNSDVLGQHYFVPNPEGAGLSPKWDFTSSAFNHNHQAFVVAAKVSQAAAPTGPQDIPWVSLKRVTGKLAKQVYRTDTRLGQPPATCTYGSPEIEVKYAAMYWFYGANI